MEELLFKEVPEESEQYQKIRKENKGISMIISILVVIPVITLMIVAIVDGFEAIMYMLLGIAYVALICMPICMPIAIIQHNNLGKYLYIYSDKIIVKRGFHKEECISLAPEQYQIILLPVSAKSLCIFKMKFVEKSTNKKLFEYKAKGLFPSHFQAPRNEWENEFLKLECDIIDDNEIIKNRPARNKGEPINEK